MTKVLITGGKGILGSEIIKQSPDSWEIYSPTRAECDITDFISVQKTFNQIKPDLIIHAAAYVDTFGCEVNREDAIDNNIIGTANLVKSALNHTCKFVYISSEYVFSGDKGDYSIQDKLDPKNVYGKTKASSEYIVSILPEYQIIRMPFVRKVHTKAFKNQYSTKHFLDVAVKELFNTMKNDPQKIVHICGEKMSIYDLYKAYGYKVIPTYMNKDHLKILPQDTSLINNQI